MVIGFAIIFGIINLNLARLSNTSVSSMVGYNESSTSRTVANAGANVGMAMLADNFFRPHGVLLDQNFATGPFAKSGFTISWDSIATDPLKPYLMLKSISRCTTFTKQGGQFYVIRDTVEVRFDCTRSKSFSTLGWMSNNEGNVFFIEGDSLWGNIHSNSNIHINGKAVFMGKVTTSGGFDPKISTKKKPTDNKAIFNGGWEEGVQERPFPNDLSDVIAIARNTTYSTLEPSHTNSRATNIWVELDPGTLAEQNGKAMIYTVAPCTTVVNWVDKWGHSHSDTYIEPGRGVKIDEMPLDSTTNQSIYTTENVYVSGTLDGRFSIAAGKDVIITNDIRYEREPNPKLPLYDPVNQTTTDMLGLIARNNVRIADNLANNANDLFLDAAVFALTGSFEADNYNGRDVEGKIRLIGSIAQNERGAIGNFSGDELNNGYLKAYRYDTRLDNPDKEKANPQSTQPPGFPGFSSPGPLKVISWWESTREPFDFQKFE